MADNVLDHFVKCLHSVLTMLPLLNMAKLTFHIIYEVNTIFKNSPVLQFLISTKIYDVDTQLSSVHGIKTQATQHKGRSHRFIVTHVIIFT